MRARVAYISSLGTTAILVAAALMLLAVVSAIVAFRGWPGAATGGSGVQSVPLAPHGATRTALVRRSPKPRGLERAAARRPQAAPRRSLSTAGLVKDRASGPRVVPGVVMVPVTTTPMRPSGPGHVSAQPAQQAVPTQGSDRPLPDQGGPVPGGGDGITIPLPVPAPPGSPPSADQVTTMVGTLLSGGSPPPPNLLDVIDIH